MRLYRAEVIRSIRFESNDFLAVAEILVQVLRRGYRVVEHPMPLTCRQYGTSKAVILRLIKDHTLFLGRLMWYRVRIPTPPLLSHGAGDADCSKSLLMMQAWWQGSRLVAWSRWVIQRLQSSAAESVTVRWLRLWRCQWRSVGRPQKITLFTRGYLLGFVVALFYRIGSLTLRELIIRILVLLWVWVVMRWFVRSLTCVESADK